MKMAEAIKIKPPYAPAITAALSRGMTYEMIDAAIGCEKGWSKKFYEGYLDLCDEIKTFNKTGKWRETA